MSNTDLTNTVTATDLRLALSDSYPDSTYGAVPVIDQYDALEAYRASNNWLRLSDRAASADAVRGLHRKQWIRCDRGKEHASGSVASNRICGSELT